MKSFKEIREMTNIGLDERFIKKGSGVLLAKKSGDHGVKAVKHFKKADHYFDVRFDDIEDKHIRNLFEGLSELSKGLIEVRNQNGVLTSMILTGLLLKDK